MRSSLIELEGVQAHKLSNQSDGSKIAQRKHVEDIEDTGSFSLFGISDR